MIWVSHTRTHTKPLADKRDRAMEFDINTIVTSTFVEGQKRFVLGQTMDFSTIV
jgi:hypothetical protein